MTLHLKESSINNILSNLYLILIGTLAKTL